MTDFIWIEEPPTMIDCQVLTISDVLEAGCEAADYAGNAEFCLLWRKAKTTPVISLNLIGLKVVIDLKPRQYQ